MSLLLAEKINNAIAVLLTLGFAIRNENGQYVVYNNTGTFLVSSDFQELVNFGEFMKKELSKDGAEND